MQGLTLVDLDIAKAQLGARADCAPRDCAAALLEAALVDVSALVAVLHDEAPARTRVVVTLGDRGRHRYQAAAEIESGDVRAATTRALLKARALQFLGPGPWLRVDGSPDGSKVLLDGRVAGTLPYRACIRPGAHKLQVQAAGYLAFEQALQIPEVEERTVEVSADLAPDPTQGSVVLGALGRDETHGRSGSEPEAAWMVAPMVVGVAGLALGTITTVRLVVGVDSCVNADAAGRCTEQHRVQLAPTLIYYSLSAALIGAAVVWLVVGSSDDDLAWSAAVGPAHVVLTRRF